MKVCDKCHKNKPQFTLRFRTKVFEICEDCAKKVVGWLEKKPMGEQLSSLWDDTSKKFGGI